MRKVFTLIIICTVILGSSSSAFARGFLVKGGLTYSNVSRSDLGNLVSEFKTLSPNSFTGWHAGIGFQTAAIAGFSIQPELMYNVKGSKLADGVNWEMAYVDLPVNIQWGIDLLVARPFVFASPFVGYNLSNKISGNLGNIKSFTEDAENLEYGLGIGAGIDIFKLQITAKYGWNFGHVASFSDYTQAVKDADKSTGALEVSIAFRF